ncbi:hypothetical protein Ancab_017867 [Ancistrocladus abbreviatus]
MSSSSAVVDSGRSSGHKSTFSQTCNLLSQYLKEKRSLGDLGLGIADNVVETKGTNNYDSFRQTTMNLFPQQAGFGSSSCQIKTEPPVAQMTIFYGGQVIVFNDFPAEKAKEIMELASRGSSRNLRNGAAGNINSAKPVVDPANLVPANPQIDQERAAPFGSDLPIARKASLHRFLEKRKDRIIARAPYSTNKPEAAASNPIESGAWLGLAAAQASFQPAEIQF